MIVVDTNILVRYAVKDDLRQAAAAITYLKKNRCIILKTVLLELAWVLSSAAGYNLPKDTVCERLRHICGLPTISVEDPNCAAQAINCYEQGMDFADALHLASSEKFSGFATMDKRLIKKALQIELRQQIILVEE